MTRTTSTTRGRRLAAVALSLPLALSLTGTALAAGPAAELRPVTAGAQGAERSAEVRAEQSAPAGNLDNRPEGAGGSSQADRPTDPVAGEPSQPISTADGTGSGADPGSAEQCASENPYCSNGTGLPSGNGVGDGQATGKPCAGCVGQADNKNPPGQAPGGSDGNAGYECDRNQGIGQTNPAHTGCTPATEDPDVGPQDACPLVDGIQPAGTDCTPGGGGSTDACPLQPGDQAPGTTCETPGGGGGGVVDVCPDVAGVQLVGPCTVDGVTEQPGSGGGTPAGPGTPTKPGTPATPGTPTSPVSPGGGTPVGGSTPAQPGIIGDGSTPRETARTTVAQGRVTPTALPFTGADVLLLLAAGGALVVGGVTMVAAARRTGRSAV